MTDRALPAANLAAQINAEHRAAFGKAHEAKASAEQAMEHAYRAGALLLEVKASVGHGRLATWLTENCEFGQRQAQRYMRAAKRRPEIEAKSDAKSHLTLTTALECIAEEAPERPASPDVPIGSGCVDIDQLAELLFESSPAATPSTEKPTVKEVAQLQARVGELEEANESLVEVAALARELDDKLSAYQNTEPDEQQKEILRLQLDLRKMEADRDYWKRRYYDENHKAVEAIRQVNRQRKALARLGSAAEVTAAD